MLDLTKTNLAVAQALKPYIEAQIVDNGVQFYKNLEHHVPLLDIINKYSSIERLKKSLCIHMYEMFYGVMNEEFILKRKKIATIHVKIGLTQKWYIASFQEIFHGVTEVLRQNFQAEDDRLIGIQTINKLINLEQQVVLEAYDDEVMDLKEDRKSTRLNSSHVAISYAVFCLKKKTQ